MAGVAMKRMSKWDTQEISPDIVEISEDEYPPMNTDDHRKYGDLLPNHTNDNGNQLGESQNLKSDAFMHESSTEYEEEHTGRLNKDIMERHSKVPSLIGRMLLEG